MSGAVWVKQAKLVVRTDHPHVPFIAVTSVLQHRTRAILRTSGWTSSTALTYSGPSPSHLGPTPNLNVDHTAHRSSGPSLQPACLHRRSPDQDYALRCNSNVLRATTGLLCYMGQLRRTPDVLRTSMRISTFTSDFQAACQAASPSLMLVLRAVGLRTALRG
jgi:hypothetical protein